EHRVARVVARKGERLRAVRLALAPQLLSPRGEAAACGCSADDELDRLVPAQVQLDCSPHGSLLLAAPSQHLRIRRLDIRAARRRWRHVKKGRILAGQNHIATLRKVTHAGDTAAALEIRPTKRFIDADGPQLAKAAQ